MIRNFDFIVTTFVFLVGIIATCLAIWWRQRRFAEGNLHSITKWPLQAREVVTGEERRVWHWLHEAFEGHQILLKTPVTCFTAATSKRHGRYWHPLLRGMYCTFSICSTDGYVIGCVDVLKETRRLPISQRQLRRALLSRCSIAYIALEPDYLPSFEEIRLKLLGSPTPDIDISIKNESCLGAARRKLHEALARRRRMLYGLTDSQLPNTDIRTIYLAEEGEPERTVYLGDWQRHDSFMVPLDGK